MKTGDTGEQRVRAGGWGIFRDLGTPLRCSFPKVPKAAAGGVEGGFPPLRPGGTE